MKKILMTGVNSYVGNSFAEWINDYPNDYSVDKISVGGDAWKEVDFSIYDTVLHDAGIAHVSTEENKKRLYYEVSRELTIEIARVAKQAGVKQVVILISITIYRDSKEGKIVSDQYSKPKPRNFYGQSKLEAEKGIIPIENDDFKIAIIRPPMIYGKESKGNYP